MNESVQKIKRQIELIGIILQEDKKYSIADLAEIFDIQELTIKRDLKEIRSMGVDIHSTAKRGVSIEGTLDPARISELLHFYTGTIIMDKGFARGLHLFSKNRLCNAVSILTILNRGIESATQVKIIYQKNEKEEPSVRIIEPYLIYEGENVLRLMAVQDGKTKQFLLDRIICASMTAKKFSPTMAVDIERMLQNSFKSWISDTLITIRLKFDKRWAKRLDKRQMFVHQKFVWIDDDTALFEAEINSINEAAT